MCQEQRKKDIEASRTWYKLTKMGAEKKINFPLEAVPFLNQTMKDVQFRAAIDPVDSNWLAQFTALSQATENIAKHLMSLFATTNFTKAEDYIRLFEEHKKQIEAVGAAEKFANPSLDSSFTDFISKEKYLSDDMFVQQRLAGLCPFNVRVVTVDGSVGFKMETLDKMLNAKYDFDEPLQKVLRDEKATLTSAVEDGALYILYHEENENMVAVKDFFLVGDNHVLVNMTSPIALFVRAPDTGELKVFAIQTDSHDTSPVFTPSDDEEDWLMAKEIVNLSDLDVCQAIWHLNHVHLSSGVYCAIYKSHFSKFHPIHQIMQYHCEGTTPHISLSYGALVAPEKFGTTLFSISHTGFVDLTVKGFQSFRYDTLDYEQLIRSRGVNDKRIKYYPFRDDGEIMWRAVKKFARDFINMYYLNDPAVLEDWELQGFAAQISNDGGREADYGGRGNIEGFPNRFKRKKDVMLFLTRFIWQIVIHGAVNYPLEPYGSFIPCGPSKLYKNTKREHNSIYEAMPDAMTSIGATTFTSLLGNVRINRLFDYYPRIEDPKLAKVIKKYHKYFHECIQKVLEKRNAQRRSNGKLGFQYFEPKWVTNSVHV